MPEQLVPHNMDAEEALLGALLIGGADFLQDAKGLLPGDFYRDRNGAIWQAIQSLATRGLGVDPITVEDGLKRMDLARPFGGGLKVYLANCISRCPTPFHTGTYAAMVRDCAERRRAIEEAGRKAGEAWEGREPLKRPIYERADVGIEPPG